MPSRLWTAALVVALAAGPAAAATTFDRVTYTPPAGWTVDLSNPAAATISRTTTSSYCLVAIYAAAPASGDLAASFAAEWQSVVLRSIDPVAAPAATEAPLGNTRAAMGAAAATIKGAPAAAMLLVLDAGASVVSVLVLSSSPAAFATCSGELQPMLAGLVVRRDGPAPTPAKLVVPPPTRALTTADLAGQWSHEDRISTTYVDRHTGAYAGSDNLAFRTGWTIDAKGVIRESFFAIRNGKKIIDEQVGAVRVLPGNILDVKLGAGAQYVVRGWLQLPAMTVLRICGPFYEGIPRDVLADPDKGANLDQHWVRLAPKK